MKKYCLLMAAVLALLPVLASAIDITTANGNGADTWLSNDNQSGEGPTAVHGNDTRIRAFRAFTGTRVKIGYIRFDLNEVDGDPNSATLTFDATYTKGGAKEVNVYGLVNSPGDLWSEATTSYNTAPGFVPNPPTALANYAFEEGAVVHLGTLTTPAVPDPEVYPVTFSSNVLSLPLEDFLRSSTNGYATFIFIGSDNEVEIASKERETDNPATLNLPNCYPVKRATDPVPALYATVPAMTTTQLEWELPDPNALGGAVTCDVYFGENEPNINLPNYGFELLAADLTTGVVDLPPLEQFKTYYWMVNVNDTSTDHQFVQGKVWSFDTNNSPPAVNAGPDQYVWLNKAVVNTTSAADTYIRDATVRGDRQYMDVRGASTWGFRGYLRFDLSSLAAMGPGTISNASLTLTKVPGASRNDNVSNGRFALYGLNDVAGNTPQNWSEATLVLADIGAEWTFPIDLESGRVTNLDGTVEGISEIITGGGGDGSKITITGSALEDFILSRIDDNGLVTFIVSNPETNDRGYGIGSKENSDPTARPVLTLTFVPDSAGNDGNAVVTLSGTVTDDGLPYGTIAMEWTLESAPEGVDTETFVIDPDDEEETVVELDTVGFYVFRLTADDGQDTGTDTVQIYVGYDPCNAAQNMPGYTRNVADLNNDCFVTLADFGILASQWLDCTSLECP